MFINFCIARPKYCFILCTPAVRQLWLNEYCYVYVKLSFTSGSSGHRVTGSSFWPGVRPEFFLFSKKCPECKTYIWNAKMTKVIVRCLLLDWNHWMLVHTMNFYFYLWLLKILRPENTSSHVSRHVEFIIKQDHWVNWVSGSLDSRVTGSLGHTIRYDTRCYFNVRSKANMSQLNLPHGTDN